MLFQFAFQKSKKHHRQVTADWRTAAWFGKHTQEGRDADATVWQQKMFTLDKSPVQLDALTYLFYLKKTL